MWLRRAAWTLSVFVVIAVTLAAQTPSPRQPGPEHQKLAAFLGKWTFDGQAQASPYGPAGKLTSIDTYEWVPGGFFMIHHWNAVVGGAANKGVEILGYDAGSKMYTSRFFDNMGNSGSVKFSLNGNTWTATADSDVAGKPLKERGTITFAGDTLMVKWEYSAEGSKWATQYDSKGTRTK